MSYGGISGGTRSVQMTKQVVTTLKMVPIYEAVHVPFYTQFMKDGTFAGNASHHGAPLQRAIGRLVHAVLALFCRSVFYVPNDIR